MSDVIRLTNEMKDYIKRIRVCKKELYSKIVSSYPEVKDELTDEYSDSDIVLWSLVSYLNKLLSDNIE